MVKLKESDEDPIVPLIDDRNISDYSISTVCSFCNRIQDEINRKCEAFKVIPNPIWEGKIKHTQPYTGDNGLMFVQMTEKDMKERALSAKKISESFNKL